MLFPFATTFGQQKTIHCLPDSVQLSLEFASFDKLGKSYKLGGDFISKNRFIKQLSTNPLAKKDFKYGQLLRRGAGILATVSAVGLVYFGNEFSNNPDELFPSGGLSYSLMALMGAALLNQRGKHRMQRGIGSYNLNIVSEENPIAISVMTGYPAFGLWKMSEVRESRAFGIGIESHLYKRFFGFVDLYNQSLSTIPDILVYDEKGYSAIIGIGLDYEVAKNLHLRGKYGYGFSSFNTEIYYDNKLWDEEKYESLPTTQLGVGLRYFPLKSFGVGANANLAFSTPTFNFEITGRF